MINTLAETAVKIAANAAREWFIKHETKPVSLDAFCDCIKTNVKLHLPAALKDAKEAFDANMPKIAEQTFAAAMMIAGIEAAKESAACPR